MTDNSNPIEDLRQQLAQALRDDPHVLRKCLSFGKSLFADVTERHAGTLDKSISSDSSPFEENPYEEDDQNGAVDEGALGHPAVVPEFRTVPPDVQGLAKDIDFKKVSALFPWRYSVEYTDAEDVLQRVLVKYLSDEIESLRGGQVDAVLDAEGCSDPLVGWESVRRIVRTVQFQVVGPEPLDEAQTSRYMMAAAKAFHVVLDTLADAELTRLAEARGVSTGHVATRGPTNSREPFSVSFALRHPRSTKERFHVLLGQLTTNPADSERRREHFLLYALAGCTVSEIARFRGYNASQRAMVAVDVDKSRNQIEAVAID